MHNYKICLLKDAAAFHRKQIYENPRQIFLFTPTKGFSPTDVPVGLMV